MKYNNENKMIHIKNKILIVLSILMLSSTVQAQTTNKELYKKWKSIYDAQQQKIQKRQTNGNQPKRKGKTADSDKSQKPIKPVDISLLKKYNVVAISYELLENAQRQCRRLIENGYPALIYQDTKNYYRVIAGCFDTVQEALNLRGYILDTYPDSWILYINEGKEEKYVQNRNSDNNHIYDVVEEMPQFPGGPTALFNYLSGNIKYPVIAEKNGVQGRVILTFIVERDGSITDVTIVKSVDPYLDAEAICAVSSMPRWIPGKIGGAPVRVKYTVPVTFRLN